jgi:hypothetical protein
VDVGGDAAGVGVPPEVVNDHTGPVADPELFFETICQ